MRLEIWAPANLHCHPYLFILAVKALPLRQAAAGEAIIRVNPRDLNADTNARPVERLLLLLAMWLGTTEYILERRTFSALSQDALTGFPGKITACKPLYLTILMFLGNTIVLIKIMRRPDRNHHIPRERPRRCLRLTEIRDVERPKESRVKRSRSILTTD
jgi:hypothetical protein